MINNILRNVSPKGLITAGAIALAVGVGAPHCDRDVYTGTVIEKVSRVKKTGDDVDSKYLVSIKREDNGQTRTFEVADSPLEFKFSSSDRWAEIQEGHTYQFQTFGWRVPVFSWYENIVGFEEQ